MLQIDLNSFYPKLQRVCKCLEMPVHIMAVVTYEPHLRSATIADTNSSVYAVVPQPVAKLANGYNLFHPG